MGVPDFISLFRSFFVPASISKLLQPGDSLALDGFVWFHAAVSAHAVDVMEGKYEKAVDYVVKFVLKVANMNNVHLALDSLISRDRTPLPSGFVSYAILKLQ
jgi:hypothetical protein